MTAITAVMPATTRTISYANYFTLDFKGNVNAAALALGDVDGDEDQEFVIGSIEGRLAVFKGFSTSHAYWQATGLGTITVVTIGDICNTGQNYIVCINAEGYCHVFDLWDPRKHRPHSNQRHVEEQNDAKVYTTTTKMPVNDASTAGPIRTENKPIFTISIPVNICRALIADVDNDGQNELVLARTDCFLHAFQLVLGHSSGAGHKATNWNKGTNDSRMPRHILDGSELENDTLTRKHESSAIMETLIQTPSSSRARVRTSASAMTSMDPSVVTHLDVNSTSSSEMNFRLDMNDEGLSRNPQQTPSVSDLPANVSSCTSPRHTSIQGNSRDGTSDDLDRIVSRQVHLKFIAKWQLHEQVGTLASCETAQGTTSLLVAQHGGHFVALTPNQRHALSWKNVPGFETTPVGTPKDVKKQMTDQASPVPTTTFARTDVTSNTSASSSIVSSASPITSSIHQAQHRPVPSPPNAASRSQSPSAARTSSLAAPINAATTGKPAGHVTALPPAMEMPTEILSGLHGTVDASGPSNAMQRDATTASPMSSTALPNLVALCTMDGVVKVFDLERKAMRSMDLQPHTQLFSMSKVHLTKPPAAGQPYREFAICGWDGMTYLMDVDMNTVHFDYPNRVAAFTAGTFATEPGCGRSCLFYVNFDDTITVFHDIQLRSLRSPDMSIDMAKWKPRVDWLLQDDPRATTGNPQEDFMRYVHQALTYSKEELGAMELERTKLMNKLQEMGQLDKFHEAIKALPWNHGR